MSNTRIGSCGISLATAVSLTLLSAQLKAQDASPVEEVVVTGSYIKREGVDQFDSASPVQIITSEDVLAAGKSNIGEYVRDLAFTQNTDTVANILANQDGGQDSNTARFNIRGLGVGSTLTLFDGRRSVAQFDVGSFVPELALQRVDVVLDGGAALYGTDAVAGVVNFIPVKKFQGFKARVFYTQDDGNDFHEPKYSILWGNKFFGRLDAVAAFDYSHKSALRRTERPRYLRADDNDSAAGNPGTFTRVAATGMSGFSGPTFFDTSATPVIDPGCGTFNQGNDDDGIFGNNPSGIPNATRTTCSLKFGDQQDYAREAEELDSYANFVFELTDSVDLEFQANATLRTNVLQAGSLSNPNNNRLLIIPVANPGNPTRGLPLAQQQTVRASTTGFIPFGKSGTLPSFYDGAGGLTRDFTQFIDRYKLGARYDFGNTSWSGETYVSIQTARLDIDNQYLRLDRLREALLGRGGPNGNEFFNPSANADPRSPAYVATGPNKTANSQALVDSLFERERYEQSSQRLTYLESIVTGDLFKVPAGDVSVAAGIQLRSFVTKDRPNPVAARGLDYNTATTNILPPNGQILPALPRKFDNDVRAAFTEVEIPIFKNLSLNAAARYEDFRDLDEDTVTPKVALRYEPFSWLALRASYNEGFLAPTTDQKAAFNQINCGETFAGTDPFRFNMGTTTPVSLVGTQTCGSGNQSLEAEESETVNIGFSVRPFKGFEASLDYQTIKYDGRIQNLTNTDVLQRDFGRFLALNGLTDASFRALDMNTRTSLTTSYFASNPDPLVTRNTDGSITRVITQPENVTGNEVNVLDFRVNYGTNIADLGYFYTNLSASYFDKYEYQDTRGRVVDARGKRNADTALAPPLPEYKFNLTLGWLRKSQSASITARYLDSVLFDGIADQFVDAFPPPRTISSDTKFDVRYGVEVDNFLGGKWNLAIGSNNVLDEKADILPIAGGFESRLQDPFGRSVYLEVNYQP